MIEHSHCNKKVKISAPHNTGNLMKTALLWLPVLLLAGCGGGSADTVQQTAGGYQVESGTDKVINKSKFAAQDVAIGKENKSPAFVAGANDAGQCLSASGGKLYKNGVLQTGPVLAAKADQFVIGLTATASGQTLTAFLQRNAPGVGPRCPATVPVSAVRLQKYTVTTAGAANAAAMPASYLGANLPSINDWSLTPVYADLVKQARVFGPPTHPWGGPGDTTPLGSDGWPMGDFGLFLRSTAGDPGTYKVSFNGQANVAHMASKNTSLANKVYDPVKNLTTLDVVRADGADQLVLVFTQTGAGIKNLKVVRPGYDAVNPPLFTTEFLNHIARFKTLRLMDWLRTNDNSAAMSWAARTTLTTHYAAPTGVPWEHIIALANQAQKDIWINIPVGATDDYVLQLAKLLKASLNASSKIYVEYSNEVWNSSFGQFAANRNLATAEIHANPKSTLAYDGTTDVNTLGFRRTAKRGMEISNIFRSVYGGSAMMSTVRPVFASQVVQPYIGQVGLDFINALYSPPSNYFYAYAGAPYFNLGSLQQVDGLTPTEILNAMDASVTSLPTVNHFENNLALTSWYGLPFIAYEGGSDTFGIGSIAAKKAASLDPRMLGICKRYMSTWYANGGAMFMWFTAGAGTWDTRYGTWELTPDMALTDTPKIKCMDATLAAPLPALTGRNTVPGTFSAWAYAGNMEPYSEASKTGVRYLHPGSHVDYVMLAPAGGTYSFVLNAEAGATGTSIDVAVNAKTVASAFEIKKTGWGTPADNLPIAINLKKGFNTLRITTHTETNGFSPISLTVR
jgi:hypothetical protein